MSLGRLKVKYGKKGTLECWNDLFFLPRYTPVQLPRADIKPYHESYFADNPPTQQHVNATAPAQNSGDMLPVEGLAASLHARILNTQGGKSEPTSGSGNRRWMQKCNKNNNNNNDHGRMFRYQPYPQQPIPSNSGPVAVKTEAGSTTAPSPPAEPHSNSSTPKAEEPPTQQQSVPRQQQRQRNGAIGDDGELGLRT